MTQKTENQKVYWKNWYTKNAERHKANTKRNERQRIIKYRKLLLEYKGNKCSLCDYSKCTRALEYHHLDPKTKKGNISEMLASLRLGWDTLKTEADKCVLLCANCHREVEAGITKL